MTTWLWLTIALAVLLLLAALVVRAVVMRRRRARRRPPRLAPRAPIVLAHGLFGFDELRVPGRPKYFRGVADHLCQMGADVHCPRVPAVAPIAERAERLAAFVRELPGDRITIVAHSMGGLDARLALAHLGMGGKVGTLITIGTPHRGTPIAGVAGPLAPLFRVLGMDPLALAALSPERMEAFNKEVPDVPGVTYASVVARVVARSPHPLLIPSHAWLTRRCGDNDGLVPASSQPWGVVLEEIDADHWAQIGWSGAFDTLGLYERLILREKT